MNPELKNTLDEKPKSKDGEVDLWQEFYDEISAPSKMEDLLGFPTFKYTPAPVWRVLDGLNNGINDLDEDYILFNDNMKLQLYFENKKD